MKYTHITLDVGAAIKAFQVVWNNTQAWSDTIIHLGDFHAIMAFFRIIGSFIKGSGFEEIIFQLGFCASGSIKSLISGKQYNYWEIQDSVMKCENGQFGKTAQYYMQYIKLVEQKHLKCH